MGNVPYRDIPAKLRRQVDFNGNSMFGFNTTKEEYLVKSYDTIIGGWRAGISDTGWWVRDDYYSATTSRHQNLIRALDPIVLSWEEYCERDKALNARV